MDEHFRPLEYSEPLRMTEEESSRATREPAGTKLPQRTHGKGAAHGFDTPALGNSVSAPQLAQVLNAATQFSICATDLHGTITVFNSGAERMLGYSAAELVGKHTPEFFHLVTEVEQHGRELSLELGHEVRGFEVLVAYAKAGRFESREWTYVRQDGSFLTVNLVVTAVKDAAGCITGFLGVAEDITERKRSEEALRKSEERFDLAVAGSNDGLWDWDVLSNEVYYSPRFKELLGFRDDEFRNTFASFETRLHPDDRQRTLLKVRRHLEGKEPYDVEYRLRTKDGGFRWFRARGQAIWDSSGRAIRMAGSITDLTKSKQTEAALKRYATDIQRANETLRMAERDARRAVVERDRFLAMLSHELRNPLAAMLNAVGVMEHTGADASHIDRARQAIRRQAQHISILLDDLLDVARITQGKIEFRGALLDMHRVVVQAIEVVQPAIEKRQQTLRFQASSDSIWVDGDVTRLLQIVENLLTNASKYTPESGSIWVELESAGGECWLRVRDSGRGIEPDILEDIFDMFYQSSHALDRSDGGMGVGLTLVRSLVQMHGGTVTAHSQGPGCGSEFVVRLPLATPWPDQQPPQIARSDEIVSSSRAESAPGKNARVVLVEDNPDSRDMLQGILELEGYDVQVAGDGKSGLDAILEYRPHVALVDIGLPIIDGYEVARRVRDQLPSEEILLVALTGYGQAKDRQAALDAGFDRHLVKPRRPE